MRVSSKCIGSFGRQDFRQQTDQYRPLFKMLAWKHNIQIFQEFQGVKIQNSSIILIHITWEFVEKFMEL